MMTSPIETRLAEAGLALPEPTAPVAAYVPFQIHGDQLFISGQIPIRQGKVVTGLLGKDTSLEDGMEAARLCGLSILAQAKLALKGDLSRLGQCLRLGGFVASTADFFDHPKVINGASELMLLAMGEEGRHTRAAVGVSALPLGAAVEVDALFSLR